MHGYPTPAGRSKAGRWLNRLATLVLPLLGLPGAALAAVDLEVNFEGVSDELHNNVQAFVTLYQQRNEPSLSLARMRSLHRQAPGEIRQALRPFGYYEPEIRSELKQQGDQWQATYHIETGPPVTVETLDLKLLGDGQDDPALQNTLADIDFHEGDVFRHPPYEEIKKALRATAGERGYFDAHFTVSRVEVRPEDRAAVIKLHFDTGQRYRFGTVELEQDALRDSFVRSFLPFEKGDPYLASKLLELQSALIDSDYFAIVEVQPLPQQATEDQVPIQLKLEAKPRHRYTAGVGYGTDTGLRGSVGWENRRVNKRGHRSKIELKRSEIGGEYSARYSIPIRDPRTDQVQISASQEDEDSPPGETTTRTLGLSRTVKRPSDWLETIYLRLQNETFEVADERRTSNLVLPGITWSRVVADNQIFARRGWRVSLDLRGTTQALGSDARFTQGRIQSKLIHSPWSEGRFIFRGQVGATALGNLSDLPNSQRFLAGGDQSVRGYQYRSLGPRNEDGELLGGKHLLVGSTEYEHQVVDKWSVALFYDVGNALETFQDAFDTLEVGAGFGVRWRSPVGQVRIDLAWAISQPSPPVRLHLNIGPDL